MQSLKQEIRSLVDQVSINAVAGMLLVGGASSRIRGNKLAFRVGDSQLGMHCARALAGVVSEAILLGDPGSNDELDYDPLTGLGRDIELPAWPQVADLERRGGPLQAFIAGLNSISAHRVLLLSADLPNIHQGFLEQLLHYAPESQVVVPSSDERLHPLCAVYRRADVLPVAEKMWAQGKRSMNALLDALEVVEWPQPKRPESEDPLFNLNKPEDALHFLPAGKRAQALAVLRPRL